jgi:hypothetical protein
MIIIGENMKAEEVSLIAGSGAGVGAFASRYVESVVPFLNNKWINAGVGVALAVAGWVIDMDGVGDFIEGFGVGYTISAVL